MNTIKLYLSAIAVLFSQVINAQSNNCGAVPQNLAVNAACVTEPFTNNQDGTGQTVNASCSGGYGTAYEDVWYSVTGTGNPMTITLSGANRDAVLAAFTACGVGELACTTINGGTSGSIVFPTTFGTTYYIQIQRRSGNNNANQNGNICAVSAPGGGGGPANDDPCAATALSVNATCISTTSTNATATASLGVPAPGCANYAGGDVWFTVTVPATGNVIIEMNTAGGFTDGGMAVYSGPCGGLGLIDCDDDGGVGLMPLISLSGQTPGATLWVRVWEYGNDNNGAFDICAYDGGGGGSPTNVNCNVPDPICSGTPIQFTAQSNGTAASVVNPGNNYGCLFTTPNPSWYYLEISGAGNLVIDITAGADIDFAIWGPYPNLPNAIAQCESHAVPLDCSYSISPIEQAIVPGVLVGQVYVLLVTNYAAVVQMITINEAAANSASTNCAILLPVELESFTGTLLDGTVQLNWVTASEHNNDYFAVERSTNGAIWSTIDIVQGVGNTTERSYYSARDAQPTSGNNYYRLKQFDINGSIKISETIGVKSVSEIDLELTPNPAKNMVLVSSRHAIATIQITDLQGTTVIVQEIPSKVQCAVDIASLGSGMYVVTILTSEGRFTERLIIE